MGEHMPIVQLNRPPRPKRHRPLSVTRREGRFIKYKLSCAGWTVTAVADIAGVGQGDVSNVLAGRRHSRAVEARIASILGYRDWDQMVLAVRLILAA